MNYKIKALPDFVRTLKRLGKKYHLTIYDKAERESISQKEIEALLKEADLL